MVVEGIYALPAAIELRDKFGLETPIISAINEIVNGRMEVGEVVEKLMLRAPKTESR